MFEFEKLYVNSSLRAHEMLGSYVRKEYALPKGPMMPIFLRCSCCYLIKKVHVCMHSE